MIDVPREYTFFIDPENNDNSTNLSVYKDGLIPNRYWFMYPQDWKTSMNKEPMIAMRRMTINKCYRKIRFTFAINRYLKNQVIAKPDKEINFKVVVNIDFLEDLREIHKAGRKSLAKAIKKEKLEDVFDEDYFFMDFEYKPLKENNDYSTNRLSFVEIFKVPEETPDYYYSISIYNMSEDFKQVFNYHDELDIMDSYYDINFYDVWDRHTCFVKSSISSMNAKNHFCQTDQTYTSFKTYKLNTEADRFWLEFYNSRNIDVPNIFPKDGKEGLIFEAQLITIN